MNANYKTIQNTTGIRLVALCMLSALLLSAYRVPKTTVAQEAPAARRKPVVSEDTHADSEPNLEIEFTSVELTVGTITSALEPSMPFSLSMAEPGGPASRIVATFEKHDIEGQPQVVSSSTSVNASVEAVDSTFKLTLTLAEGTTSETREVVVIRIDVEGRNGRTNSKQVRVFVNSGGFVGQILPSPVIEGSSDAFQVKLQSSRFTTNKFEGSILYVDVNANGNHDAGEPITTVDADNQFRFPNPKAFYYEHLIRPLSLVVDEKPVDPAKFTTHLLDEGKPWFKIGPADEDDGGGEGPVPGPPEPFEVGNAAGRARPGGDSAALREREKNTTELTENDDAPHAVEANEDDGATKFFVDSRVAASGNGAAWPQAFKTLPEALTAAKALVDADANNRAQIRVADGVYTPPTNAGFAIPKNVSLFGGFAGDEDTLGARPRIKRGTILSGDIDGNDGHFAPVVATAISPNGKFIATASEDRTVKIWKSEDGTLAATLHGHLQSVLCLNFAPTVSDPLTDEAYRLVTGGKDMTIRLWHLNDSGAPLTASRILAEVESQQFSHYGTVLGVSISPNGNRLASASEDGTIGMWDISDPQVLRLVTRLRGHEGAVNCLAFVDDSTIASGGDDRTVRTWLDSGGAWRASEPLINHTGRVTQVAVVRPGATFVSGSEDATIRIWKKVGTSFRPGSESPLNNRIIDSFGPVTGLAAAPNQRSLVSSHRATDGAGNWLCVWQVDTGQFTTGLRVPGAPISRITVAALTDVPPDVLPQNYWIVGGRADGTSSIWPVTPLESEFAGQTSVAAISPNGQRVATVEGNTVKLRTVGDDSDVDDLAHNAPVSALCFSRSGAASTHLATGSNTMLRWLNVDDPNDPPKEKDTSHHINCIAVSVDDVWLATGGEDKVVKVWKASDLAADPIEFGGHLQPITAVSFVGEGENAKVVSASEDGTIKIWNLKKKLIETTIDAGASVADITVTGTEVDLTVFAAQSVDKFDDVRLRSTQPLQLRGVSGVIVDGVQVEAGDPILVTGQGENAEQENGIWVVAEGAWTRALDANQADEFQIAKHVLVTEGLAYAGQFAKYTGPAGAIPGTDNITFADSVGTVAAWHWNATEETLTALDAIPAYFVNELEFAGDGQTLIAGDREGSLSVWKRDGTPMLRRIEATPHSASIDTVSVSVDGDQILTASNGTVRIWDQSPIGTLTSLASFPLSNGADNAKSLVTVANDVTNVTLDGFVIKGGWSSDTNGGAIRIGENAGVELEACVLEGNRAQQGGAIGITTGAATLVSKCYFGRNSSLQSGGAVFNQAGLTLSSCVFHSNHSENNDGGAVHSAGTELTIKQCTVTRCNEANGSAISATTDLTIHDSTIVGNGQTPAVGLTGATLTLHNTIIARDFSETPGALAVGSKSNLLQTNLAKTPSLIADNYFYSEKGRPSVWEHSQSVDVGDVFRPIDGPPGLAFLCIRSGTTGPEGAQPEWPTEVNKDVKDGVEGTHVIWWSVFDLSVAPLFADFGDQGGLHETLPLTSDAVARDIGSDASGLKWDQRGENYVRSYGAQDIGAFEWQPLPASHADTYEFNNSQTDFVALGDPLVNDARPRINSTLTIANDVLATENPTIHFQEVRLVATTGLAQPLQGQKTIDGELTANGDRVLLVRQGGGDASPSNGIYVVDDVQWRRAGNSDDSREMLKYKTVRVSAGNSHAGTTWTLTHDAPGAIPVLGTTALAFDSSWMPTTFGQAKIVDGRLQYRLKAEFNKITVSEVGFLGRDEINYVSHFGDLVSAPARATVWIVGPAENVGSAGMHRFVVNSTADHPIDSGPINFNEGGLTLREAMLLATRTEGNDLIEFDAEIFKDSSTVIYLDSPLEFPADAQGSLTIQGPGIDRLSIDGRGKYRGLELHADGANSQRFSISRLVFQNCKSPTETANGGAILVSGSSATTVEYVGFVGNVASSGGAIHCENDAIAINQCTFVENQSIGDAAIVSVVSPKTWFTAVDGETVVKHINGSVFWRNHLPRVDNAEVLEKVEYRHSKWANFLDDPRFVAEPDVIGANGAAFGNIKLRRDSLAFRDSADAWTANSDVLHGTLVHAVNSNKTLVFECTTAGTTGATEPNWPTAVNESVSDNDVVWTLVADTFRFLGAYPKPPGSAEPFGDPTNAKNDTLYVDSEVRIPGDGGSWKTALRSLGDAIEIAAADYRVTTIKIAGKHSPTRPHARTTSDDSGTKDADWTFTLQHGLTLEGGYPSAETFEADADDDRDETLASDPASYPTILSGLLTLEPELKCKHVLSAYGVRGFHVSKLTVTDGDGKDVPGGGLFIPKVEPHAVGNVSGVMFHSNSASTGGAIYLSAGILEVRNSTFESNGPASTGGAISVLTNHSILRAHNSTFVGNKAGDGGAIHVTNGDITLDHLTIIRNYAQDESGVAGLFVNQTAGAVNDTITNTIVCENVTIAGASKNTNYPEDALDESNVVDAKWANSLLAKERFNEFQTLDETRNGPTRTVAILPQIPFRMGAEKKTLTQASQPRTPESATDQRGAAGTSLARSDVGAFERQYFIHEKSMTRFFIVDDDRTRRQLWAEVVDRKGAVPWPHETMVEVGRLVYDPDSDLALVFQCTAPGMTGSMMDEPEWPTVPGATVNDNGVVWRAVDAATTYVQVSQHVGNNPRIRSQPGGGFAVQPNGIEFEIDSQALAAISSNDGLVQPSTLFPSGSLSVTSVTMNATSYIKLQLTAGGITLVDESGLPETEWTVNEAESDGQIVDPQDIGYRIELKSNDITVETLRFNVSRNDQ